MEFGKHIGKGLWAFADKSLPALYGVGFVILVIRVLSPEEYGLYVLVQTVFLILFTFAHSISLQPMLKFVAEGSHNERYISAGVLVHICFYVVAVLILWLVRKPLAFLLNAEKLVDVMLFVPLLVVSSLVRNIMIVLLQARFRMKEIFWIDAVHFLGSLVLLFIATATGMLTTAAQVLQINVVTFSLSSVVAVLIGRTPLRFSIHGIRQAALTLWNFGKYTFAGNAGYALTAQVDSFLLSWYSGPVAVAFYNAAKVFYRAYDIVAQLIQMFVIPASSKLTAEGNRADLQAMFEKTILFTSVVLVPSSVLLLIFAPTIMHFFYGTKYDEAIGVLQILALASIAVPWLATMAGILLGSGKVRLLFQVILVFLTTIIVALVLFVPLWNMDGAAWALVVSHVVAAIVLAVALNRSGVVEVRFRGILLRYNDVAVYAKKKLFS